MPSIIIAIILIFIPFRLVPEYYIFSTIDENNESIICGKDLNSEKVFALIISGNDSYLTYLEKIRQLNRKIKKLKNNRRTIRLKSYRAQLKRNLEDDNQLCLDAFNLNPSPSPTPTNNFDNNGNTIRGAFYIPTDLTGNINVGRSIYIRNCIGCHEERRHRNFNEIQAALNSVPEMNGKLDEYELRQAIAHITAYLNRHNL